jgi:ribosomal protein L3 glutamine methyltransferase
MSDSLHTIVDLIRFGASRLTAAGLSFGHHSDNALDEAKELVLHTLGLPHDFPAAIGSAQLLPEERQVVLEVFERRIRERVPAVYLTGQALFAELSFKSDARALVPRSPIAELILAGFSPWLDGRPLTRALDLCTGSGCIGIAIAVHNPGLPVDLVDLSPEALTLAAENIALHKVGDRVRAYHGDLFEPLPRGACYDLIVSNPPYITTAEYEALPAEYAHEPKLGLEAGADGLDVALKLLRDAPRYLSPTGVLIVEVGEAERALSALLPELPLIWLEFSVGQMGIFAITAAELAPHQARLAALCTARGL